MDANSPSRSAKRAPRRPSPQRDPKPRRAKERQRPSRWSRCRAAAADTGAHSRAEGGAATGRPSANQLRHATSPRSRRRAVARNPRRRRRRAERRVTSGSSGGNAMGQASPVGTEPGSETATVEERRNAASRERQRSAVGKKAAATSQAENSPSGENDGPPRAPPRAARPGPLAEGRAREREGEVGSAAAGPGGVERCPAAARGAAPQGGHGGAAAPTRPEGPPDPARGPDEGDGDRPGQRPARTSA